MEKNLSTSNIVSIATFSKQVLHEGKLEVLIQVHELFIYLIIIFSVWRQIPIYFKSNLKLLHVAIFLYGVALIF